MPNFKIAKAEYDGLGDEVKGFYEEDPQNVGQYRMVQDPGLKSTVETLRSEVAKFKDYPTAEELQGLRAAKQEADKAKEAEITDMQKLRDHFAEKEASWQKERDGWKAAQDQQTLGEAARKALTSVGASKDAMDLLMPQVTGRLALENGRITVKAADGSPSFDSIEGLVKDYKANRPTLFESAAPGGAGAGVKTPSGGEKTFTPEKGQAISREDYEKIPVMDRNKFWEDGGKLISEEA